MTARPGPQSPRSPISAHFQLKLILTCKTFFSILHSFLFSENNSGSGCPGAHFSAILATNKSSCMGGAPCEAATLVTIPTLGQCARSSVFPQRDRKQTTEAVIVINNPSRGGRTTRSTCCHIIPRNTHLTRIYTKGGRSVALSNACKKGIHIPWHAIIKSDTRPD